MKSVHIALLITLFCCAGVLSATAQDRIQESSTGKYFPVQTSITSEGKTYSLTLTGTAVRKKMMFKVYGIAHHMEDPQPGSLENVLAGVLTDGKAKQITMEFVRDVDVEKIQEAYRDGFKENTTEAEARAIAPLVEQFLGYFTKEIKEDDRFVLQWLPGGMIIAQTQGTTHPPVRNIVFARALWTIWMGEDSIVDREDLLERIVK